jgi:DNA-binding response OmpR family regulator
MEVSAQHCDADALNNPSLWNQIQRTGLLNRFRVLWVSASPDAGQWLSQALSDDRACEVQLINATTHAAGLSLLRNESFNLILVQHNASSLEAPEFVSACRGGGHEEPLLVLGEATASDLQALCCEAGADDYLCLDNCTTRGLLWSMSRAIQRFELQRENQRLQQNEAQRNQSEQIEGSRLLSEQRAMVDAFESGTNSNAKSTRPSRAKKQLTLPEDLIQHYRELLRAHIIMGTGTLNREMQDLAAQLISLGASATQTMQMHLQVVETLVQGLGKRSARHILLRADLLVMELLIHLATGYRVESLVAQHVAA